MKRRKRMLYQIRAFCGVSIRMKYRRQAARYLSQTADCRAAQKSTLARLLALNAGGEFSKVHGLDGVADAVEFRKRLPVCDYQTFHPYIERVKEGEFNALLGPANQLLMFSLSSGTTSHTKFIPITKQFLQDYRRSWQVWGIRAFDDHPGSPLRNMIQLASEEDRYRTPAGTPCGNISGLVASMQNRMVRSLYSVPQLVAKITDPEEKLYSALRFSVADENVGTVTTANPSTLLQLCRLAEARREDLIRDIADGTLASAPNIDGEIVTGLRRSLRPNRERSRQLEQIVERTGRLYPREYWPEMGYLAVWSAGSCGAYIPSLRPYFGDVPIRDHGLSASEGRMTIPLWDDRPDGVLDVNAHYFEFIPEAEHGTKNPTVLEAHELQRDQNYFILLTTSSGLYRYDICDVVRCTGFYGSTPLLKFLHKGTHISNITGEKLSESQIADALRHCVERTQISPDYFSVAPLWADPPRYQLMLEEQTVSSVDGEQLANEVDAHLQKANCEYRDKRLSGRLAPIEWISLPQGTWKKFAKMRQASLGGSFEQYKHPFLIPEIDFSRKFVKTNGEKSDQSEVETSVSHFSQSDAIDNEDVAISATWTIGRDDRTGTE